MGAITVNRKFVYSELEESLRQKILNGELNYKLPIPGEENLARQHGISRPSARKAIQILVKEGLLERNQGGGTYVVPPANRAKSIINKNLSIHVGISYLNKFGVVEYDEQLLEGASEYAYRTGHTISYFDSADFDENKILNKWNNHEIDAIAWLAIPKPWTIEAIKRFKSKKIPQLLFQKKIEGLPFVKNDDKKSLRRIIQFLHNYGHSKIGFVNHTSQALQYQELEAGYFEAMKTVAGIDDCNDLYLHIPNKDFDKTFKNIDHYLSNITALILGGFTFLHPFLSLFEDKNIRIPNDLSVICMDDTYAARSYNPPISVYSKSRAEQGKQMVHIIESLIRGGLVPGEEIVTNGELIIRESCNILNK